MSFKDYFSEFEKFQVPTLEQVMRVLVCTLLMLGLKIEKVGAQAEELQQCTAIISEYLNELGLGEDLAESIRIEQLSGGQVRLNINYPELETYMRALLQDTENGFIYYSFVNADRAVRGAIADASLHPQISLPALPLLTTIDSITEIDGEGISLAAMDDPFLNFAQLMVATPTEETDAAVVAGIRSTVLLRFTQDGPDFVVSFDGREMVMSTVFARYGVVQLDDQQPVVCLPIEG